MLQQDHYSMMQPLCMAQRQSSMGYFATIYFFLISTKESDVSLVHTPAHRNVFHSGNAINPLWDCFQKLPPVPKACRRGQSFLNGCLQDLLVFCWQIQKREKCKVCMEQFLIPSVSSALSSRIIGQSGLQMCVTYCLACISHPSLLKSLWKVPDEREWIANSGCWRLQCVHPEHQANTCTTEKSECIHKQNKRQKFREMNSLEGMWWEMPPAYLSSPADCAAGSWELSVCLSQSNSPSPHR